MNRSLSGTGASPGKAFGPAFVALLDVDVVEVPRGAVMVVRIFHPYFAPTLARIVGLVVAEGGVLQHAAILAREFGIPAVVGVVGALEAISTGLMVEIDGSAGTVAF